MIKVLAAELSDQARLSRGKRYWADAAVVDIVVGHGAVTAEVQGSRPQPYVVTLEASAGAGVPAKRDLWVQCTCPDDVGTGADACKHAVAALFALSDEVAIDPELIDRWRAGSRAARGDATVTALPRSTREQPDDRNDMSSDDEVDDESGGADVIELRPLRRDHALDSIGILLAAPGAIPALPDPSPIEHRGMRDRLLGDVLDDALDHLAIRWE
jgi:uncharacterized Zn finger protein